ncbi:hypothetical protein MNBD_GAMMA03-2105, partial [hydrothermal vent metagenome]
MIFMVGKPKFLVMLDLTLLLVVNFTQWE